MSWGRSSCSRLNVGLLKATCRRMKERRQWLSVVSGCKKRSIKKITSLSNTSQGRSPTQTRPVLWQRGSCTLASQEQNITISWSTSWVGSIIIFLESSGNVSLQLQSFCIHRLPKLTLRRKGVKYSRLPITRTLANSNLALTRTKIDFPWISVLLSL